jgi:hypothetical protein
MKSPGIHINLSRVELAARLDGVMQASRAIRSEVALTICESREMRIASRQLRMESSRTNQRSAASRRGLPGSKAQRSQWMAHAIAQVLSGRGYSAFVAAQPRDTASIQ